MSPFLAHVTPDEFGVLFAFLLLGILAGVFLARSRGRRSPVRRDERG